jgi:Tol biopolymer transport system component
VTSALAQVTTTRVLTLDSVGAQSNEQSDEPSLSASGRKVSFHSDASNLVPGDLNTVRDVFVRDRCPRTTVRVSMSSAGVEGNGRSDRQKISADGNRVVFRSAADNLVASDGNAVRDIFVHDLANQTTQRVSVSTAGVEADAESSNPSLSADGRFIVFESDATNLIAGDVNGLEDVFLHDLQLGTTERLAENARDPSISADGNQVAFVSANASLVAGDTNNVEDSFLLDRQAGVITRVSVHTDGTEGDGQSTCPIVAGEGGVVVFESFATNLVDSDSNGFCDIFCHDLATSVTSRISVDSLGGEADFGSFDPKLSGDGLCVVFESDATNLVMDDFNGLRDVFARHRDLATTERVSVNQSNQEANGESSDAWISADGEHIAFESDATNLVPGDFNGFEDIFNRGVAVILEATPEVLVAPEGLTLKTFEGAPSAPYALVLLEINGMPVFQVLTITALDASRCSTLDLKIPPTFGDLEIVLQSLTCQFPDLHQGLLLSNLERIRIFSPPI